MIVKYQCQNHIDELTFNQLLTVTDAHIRDKAWPKLMGPYLEKVSWESFRQLREEFNYDG